MNHTKWKGCGCSCGTGKLGLTMSFCKTTPNGVALCFLFCLGSKAVTRKRPSLGVISGRCSNGAMFLCYAVTVAFTTVPMVYDLQVNRERCGPHQGTSMKEALVDAVQEQKQVLLPCLLITHYFVSSDAMVQKCNGRSPSHPQVGCTLRPQAVCTPATTWVTSCCK